MVGERACNIHRTQRKLTMFNNVYIKVFVIDKITNSAFSYTVGLVVSDGTVVIALDAAVC